MTELSQLRDLRVLSELDQLRDLADAQQKLIATLIEDKEMLLSIAKRFVALDGGSWDVRRDARDKSDLLHDAGAAIARAEGRSS
jgi:hypothetical protein